MASKDATRERKFIYSVEKAFALLELFSQSGPQLSLSEVARPIGMTLVTATRYTNTLLTLGYLAKDPQTKKYRLTPKILSLGFSMLKEMDLRARITPHIAEINREFGIGSQCVILDETDIVYIERFRSNALVTLDLTVGSRLPAYCTALGRAILAFLESKALERIVRKINFVPLTSFTIIDRDRFMRELELTRERGYAVNHQELVLGQSALAAPIFNRGSVEGAFGFSFPPHLIEDERFRSTLVARLLDISRQVSME